MATFIITKLIADCVYRHDYENLRGSTPLHLLYRY